MKICPNCNAQLEDDAVFCTECGQSLSTDMPAIQPSFPASSPNGAEPNAENQMAGIADVMQKLKKKPAVIAVIVVIVLVTAFFTFREGGIGGPSVSVKSETMIDDYIRDQATAGQKYHNKTIHVTGNLLRKTQFSDSMDYGMWIAYRQSGGKTYQIVINVPNDKVKELNNIKQGDIVSVVGKCKGIVPQNDPTIVSVHIQADKINE